jgi:antitoxin component YwqK of YwqJK toxin-antitoxin module
MRMVVEPQKLGSFLALAASCALLAPAVAQNLVIESSCREGQPHGAYELRSPGGQVRVVGAFNKGKRTGSFLFWSSRGVRIAQLPYDEGALSGTLALWWASGEPSADPKPKLEAVYAQGFLSGIKRSWYPNGRLRTELRYERGLLVEARAYGETGTPLSDADARALAARDLETDEQFYASLDAHPRPLPRCEPASDRLEKG